MKQTIIIIVFIISQGVFSQNRSKKLEINHDYNKHLLLYAGDSLVNVFLFKGKRHFKINDNFKYRLVHGKGYTALYMNHDYAFSEDFDLWESYYQMREDEELRDDF